MAGVYAYGEFKDDFGNEWKAEIYDTTYSGFATEFTFAQNGFEIEHDYITDKPLLTPFCKKTATIKVKISEADTAMLALIDDLPNGLEDQYYLILYKKVSGTYRKWWLGMILTDICEYDDYQRFVFSISAKDGLNRLENFEYPIADIPNPKVAELLAIKYALSICGLERFYGASDEYIAIAVNWHEVNQDKTLNSLVYTRVSKQSFIEDVEEQEPKTALKGIEDLLLSYGASLRFEDGMWRIAQIETQNAATITWEYFDKSGNYLSTVTTGNSHTIGSSGNLTKDAMVRTYMPSLYMITETQEGLSDYTFAIKTDVDIFPYLLTETIPVSTTNIYKLSGEVGFVPLNITGGLTRISVKVVRNGYMYVQAVGPGSAFPIGTRDWILGTTLPVGYSNIWLDIKCTEAAWNKVAFEFIIPPPPGAASGQDLELTYQVWDLTLGTNFNWYSYQLQIRDYSVAFSTPEFSKTYEAYNSIYNAASISHDEKLFYCDSELDFVRSSKEIFDGSNWIPSQEWASGVVATTGVPFAELICQKSIYFQRKPRNIVQGSFMLPGYNSLQTLVWRSKRYLFLSGSFDAQTYTWTGVWVELLEQTTDVTSGLRNPYRDVQKIMEDDQGGTQQQVQRVSQAIGEHTGDIFNLKRIIPWDSDADVTITPEQTNLVFTNEGQTTGTTLVYDLPPIEVGLKFHFSNDSNSKTIEINAYGNTILFAGATGNTLSCPKITFITIAAISATKWQVLYCDKHNDWTLT